MAVMPEWWGGRDLRAMLPRIFFEHFRTHLVRRRARGAARRLPRRLPLPDPRRRGLRPLRRRRPGLAPRRPRRATSTGASARWRGPTGAAACARSPRSSTATRSPFTSGSASRFCPATFEVDGLPATRRAQRARGRGRQVRASSRRPCGLGERGAAAALRVRDGRRVTDARRRAASPTPPRSTCSSTATCSSWGRRPTQSAAACTPRDEVTFIVDRNINYTDYCVSGCRFCAFYKEPGSGEGYLLSRDEIFRKIEETLALGGTAIMMQGGLSPDLDICWFEQVFADIKARYPIHIHSLSPPEIAHIAAPERPDGRPRRCAACRRPASTRCPAAAPRCWSIACAAEISPHKIPTATWLEVMREAHALGMRTTATMMFGSLDTPAERVEHLRRIRDLQDETGGFTAFIPWTFAAGNTALQDGHVAGHRHRLPAPARVSRVYLDNVPNVQASWVTQGLRMGQVALAFGANDMGSTMIEENVVARRRREPRGHGRGAGAAHRRRRLHARPARHAVPRGQALPADPDGVVARADADRLSLRPQGNPFASHFGHARAAGLRVKCGGRASAPPRDGRRGRGRCSSTPSRTHGQARRRRCEPPTTPRA